MGELEYGYWPGSSSNLPAVLTNVSILQPSVNGSPWTATLINTNGWTKCAKNDSPRPHTESYNFLIASQLSHAGPREGEIPGFRILPF